jgi:hypothetical protein
MPSAGTANDSGGIRGCFVTPRVFLAFTRPWLGVAEERTAQTWRGDIRLSDDFC